MAHEKLEGPVIEALKGCFDPEIPVNIYDLGLIYNLDINDAGHVDIRMTLTSPGCPVAGTLPGDVQQRVQKVKGVTGVKVELVWEPPWDKDRLSPTALIQLGMI
jgi:FeS assembly SUF system protein